MNIYLSLFNELVDTAIHHDGRLFTRHEINVVNQFKALNPQAQNLYVRLFFRKLRWWTESQYAHYQADPTRVREIVDELIASGLAKSHFSAPLGTIINCLTVEQLNELSRELDLRIRRHNGQTVTGLVDAIDGKNTSTDKRPVKWQIIETILNFACQQTISNSVAENPQTNGQLINIKLNELFGHIITLNHTEIFNSMMGCTLAACHVTKDDIMKQLGTRGSTAFTNTRRIDIKSSSSTSAHTSISVSSTTSASNSGFISISASSNPADIHANILTSCSSERLFADRKSLDDYIEATRLADLEGWPSWNEAKRTEIKNNILEHIDFAIAKMEDQNFKTNTMSLQLSLRRYTANWVYFRALFTLAEHVKDQSEKYRYLDLFLNQELYCPEKRTEALIRKLQLQLNIFAQRQKELQKKDKTSAREREQKRKQNYQYLEDCFNTCLITVTDPGFNDILAFDWLPKAIKLYAYYKTCKLPFADEIVLPVQERIRNIKAAVEVEVHGTRTGQGKLGERTQWVEVVDEVVELKQQEVVIIDEEEDEEETRSDTDVDDEINVDGEVTITSTKMGSINGNNVPSATSVEFLALAHYKKLGWKGSHAETSIFTTLFGLLFWDIIFAGDIQNKFYHRYQPHPIDLFVSGEFYDQRREKIDERLMEIKKNIGFSINQIRRIYKSHGINKTMCTGVRWNFGQQNLIDIAKGLGTRALESICQALAKDYRSYKSGGPDLVLWNSENGKCMFAEVKSENDTLSANQKVYIDRLIRAGIRVELCKVIDKNSKIKKPNKRRKVS